MTFSLQNHTISRISLGRTSYPRRPTLLAWVIIIIVTVIPGTGVVIISEPLRELFCLSDECRTVQNSAHAQTKPTDLGHKSAFRLLSSTPTITIYYCSAQKLCSKGVQPMLTAVYAMPVMINIILGCHTAQLGMYR